MRRSEENFDVQPKKHEDAKKKWPDKKLQRAHTHKALNSLIQGSAADMTKAAMLMIWKETGKIPYMQVHDELNYGSESQDASVKLQGMAQTCVKMEVPIKADMTHGEHWK
jgi:DNA polymerase I-like protein with 3'-5' exonuclease and polymerase domains